MPVKIRNDQAAHAFVGAFVDEVARSGVRHVCIAPGSRSAPLAMLFAGHPSIETWMHIDERSAAFFALGLARGLGEPVALLCTSGTAAANFLPAVVEAYNACVPLVVITADRPPEMRDVGASQTIDQNRLFGSHAKWHVEVALPEATPEMLRYARTLAVRAASRSAAVPAGPVHLNFPFREPLVPQPMEQPADMDLEQVRAWRGRGDSEPWARVSAGAPRADEAVIERLAAQLRDAVQPVMICGPQPDSALAVALAALARSAGVPLLADPLSQLRWGPHERSRLIDRYDAFLRDEATAASLVPDLMIRFGSVPTSKALTQWMSRHASTRVVVVAASGWPDPALLADEMIHADPQHLAESLLTRFGDDRTERGAWLERWKALDKATGAALGQHSAALDEPFEGGALAEVVAALPRRATLFASSSMPVRDLDAFAAGDDREIRVMANRGANGIDGVVSTALGAAAAARSHGGGPLVLVIGDLALYHDMNGLLAARMHSLDATIVVLNNDGGGIFSFLPQAAHPAHFEQLFGTPHGLDFAHVAALYDARYSRADDPASLALHVTEGVAGRGLHIIEVRTDRGRNVELHRDAWQRVASAVRDL